MNTAAAAKRIHSVKHHRMVMDGLRLRWLYDVPNLLGMGYIGLREGIGQMVRQQLKDFLFFANR